MNTADIHMCASDQRNTVQQIKLFRIHIKTL